MSLRLSVLIVTALCFSPALNADAKASQVENQLKNLRSVPTDERPAATIKLAGDVRLLPASAQKVGYADALAHLVTEGDAGKEALQAVAATLAAALSETPMPAKNDKVPMPYYDLAKLVRYEHVNASVDNPSFAKAAQMLVDNDAALEKVDFTLKDLKGKKVTLSGLRGKIVLVNFWATWCGPCRLEMGDLDAIDRYFEPQGLVVLSITDEDLFKVGSFFAGYKYHPAVLVDPGGEVHKQFHITGIPNTFLFGRDGKLLAVAIDQRTRRQFLEMLSKTDLHQ
jgi:peroxiredoxin